MRQNLSFNEPKKTQIDQLELPNLTIPFAEKEFVKVHSIGKRETLNTR